MAITVGISTASLYPMLLEESVDELARNDVMTIEIFFNTFCEVEPEFVKNLSRRILDNGQKVVAVHPFTSGFEPFMLFGGYERRVDDSIELHKHYFAAMNQLGAEIFVFHGDRVQSTLVDEAYYERFARLRDAGKMFGITVAQENVERCKSTSLDFLKKMVKHLDGDVALVFDNKQATRSKISANAFISSLGENIIHCHMSDSNKLNDCIAIGDGNVDFKSIIQLLGKYNYKGALMVELYRELLINSNSVFASYDKLKSFFHQIY